MNEAGNSRSSGASSPSSGAGSDTRSQGLVDKVRDTAATKLTDQKNRAVDGLGSVAQAVRQSTEQLRQGEHDVLARYVEQAADQLDRFSQRIRAKDAGELMNDVQTLAKRQPALFIGGAFALGLIGARFFKSTARDEQSYGDTTSSAQWNSGGEYRGYTQSGGATAYPRSDVSRVHDYQSSPTLGEEIGAPATDTTGRADTSGPTGTNTDPRTRRGVRSERP